MGTAAGRGGVPAGAAAWERLTPAAPAPPRVSLVLCTRDHAAALAGTLEALARLHLPADLPAELLLVDNASSDDTPGVAGRAAPLLWERARMEAVYAREARPGKCHALNAALAAARGEVVLFTDDDVVPEPGWAEEMCRPILCGDADATVGDVTLAPHLCRPWMEPMHRSWLASTEEINPDGPRLVGASAAFARRVLARVPTFDTELGPGALGFNDDTLFGEQLNAAGFRLRYVPTARVEHHCDADRLSRAAYLVMAAKQGRSNAYVAYHWLHSDAPLAPLREWKARLAAARVRRAHLRRGGAGVETAPAATEELLLVSYAHYFRQFARERRRVRQYDRRGPVKRAAGVPGA